MARRAAIRGVRLAPLALSFTGEAGLSGRSSNETVELPGCEAREVEGARRVCDRCGLGAAREGSAPSAFVMSFFRKRDDPVAGSSGRRADLVSS